MPRDIQKVVFAILIFSEGFNLGLHFMNWRVGLKYPLAGPSGHCYCSSLLQKFPFFLYFFKCTFFTTSIILHWSSIQRGLLWKNRHYVTDLLCNGSKNQMERKVFAWNRNWPMKNGILLPKLFWPTVRKNCPIDWDSFICHFYPLHTSPE